MLLTVAAEVGGRSLPCLFGLNKVKHFLQLHVMAWSEGSILISFEITFVG